MGYPLNLQAPITIACRKKSRTTQEAMRCPECGATLSTVTQTGYGQSGQLTGIGRKRKCAVCNTGYFTLEVRSVDLPLSYDPVELRAAQVRMIIANIAEEPELRKLAIQLLAEKTGIT